MPLCLPAICALSIPGLPAAFPATEAIPPTAESAPSWGMPDLPVRMSVLGNGLRLVFHVEHSLPRVVMRVIVDAGAADDPPGRSGLAHLVEHLMYAGTERVSFEDYDDLLSSAGGTYNAWTDYDTTAYVTRFPPEALDRVLTLETDRLAFPTAEALEGRFATELEIIRAEQASTWGPAHARDALILNSLLYPSGHPYRPPILGADLDRLTLEDVEEYIWDWYGPSNLVVVLAGDLGPEAMQQAAERFGAIAERLPPSHPATSCAPALGEQRSSQGEDVADWTLYTAWRTFPTGHPDEEALDVASRILASNRESRLGARLLGNRQPFAAVNAWTENGRMDGSIVLRVASRKNRLERALRVLDQEIGLLAREGPGSEELERVKTGIVASFLRGIEPMESRSEVFGACLLEQGRPDCIEAVLARYLAVRPEDVQRVVSTWLPPDRRLLLSIVPWSEAPGAGLRGSVPARVP